MITPQLSRRARQVIEWLNNPDQILWSYTYADNKIITHYVRDFIDGQWIRFYAFPNTGSRTIVELVAAGKLAVEAGYKIGDRGARYRLCAVGEYDEGDFGDLWIG